MGVRGLTTFIARHSDRYFEGYELHDTYLVVDGNNIAAQLYKWHAKCHDCFGGDYDKYAKVIRDFFKMLETCNVTPLIIFDGGYEDRKLKTIYDRMRNRTKQAKRLNCVTEGSFTVFPLFYRELFAETVLKLGLKVVRCLREADYEMACIARSLGCPILSFDSDFYIFEVLYIPFSTLDVKNTRTRMKPSGQPYKYVGCQIYSIDKFLKFFGDMKRENIPLLGVLLGNDYIRPNLFKGFYAHIKLAKRRHAENDMQRRIAAVIKWLQNETYESAVRKILSRIKSVKRRYVARQIKAITNGYMCAHSELLDYLDVAQTCKSGAGPLILPNDLDLEKITDDIVSEKDSCSEDDSCSEKDSCCSETSEVSEEDDLCDETTIGGSRVEDGASIFYENYKRCVYPACFVDLIYKNRYFFVPQIENYYNIPSHTISLSILAAIYKILKSDNATVLMYVLRSQHRLVNNYSLREFPEHVPVLEDIENITAEKARSSLYEILNVNKQIASTLNEFPSSWRLYVLSIMFWIQHVKPQVTRGHVYAIIFSALLLKIVSKMGCEANEHKFFTRFRTDVEKFSKTVPQKVTDGRNLKAALHKIGKSDCIMFMREMISYFQMDFKLCKNPKLYDINIIDSFAQFQSCSYHIKYLNTLLKKPLDDYLISDFYNGTFIYNCSRNFLGRTNLNSYVDMLLKFCPNVHYAFCKMINVFEFLLDGAPVAVTNKRKRKRKKGNQSNLIVDVEEHSTNVDNDGEPLFDVNNRFSLLNCINK